MGMREARIHVIVGEKAARYLIRDFLRQIGFEDIVLGSSYDDIQIAMNENRSDLLILGTRFNDGDPLEMVRKIRKGEVGNNPFNAILAVSMSLTSDSMSDIYESGVDDLLVYPVNQKTLEQRIEVLVEKRKKFLLTADYMGPDFRAVTGGGQELTEITMFDAPNMLSARVKGDPPESEILGAIKDTVSAMEGQRIRSLLKQLCWFLARITRTCEFTDDGHPTAKAKEFLSHLSSANQKARKLMKGEDWTVYLDICNTVEALAQRLSGGTSEDAGKDMKVLSELGNAIRAAMSSGADAAQVQEIRNIVNA